MGKSPSRSVASNYNNYFKETRKNQLEFISEVPGYLENASEWLLFFKTELKNRQSSFWSKQLLKSLNKLSLYQDLSSKVAFAWKNYNKLKKVPKVDQVNVCIWRESIANLETFSFEVESNPTRRALHKYLTSQSECTLWFLIKSFQKITVAFYTSSQPQDQSINPLSKKEKSQQIDSSILDFCGLIEKIIPKYFLDFPEKVIDMESIIRDSVISDSLLALLIFIRKELEIEKQNDYLQGLQTLNCAEIHTDLLKKLRTENNSNCINAMQHLVGITQSRSIGAMHDSVVLFMNHISLSLFDPENPSKVIEDDQIIQAFCLIVAKSSAPDLPICLDILNTFMDEKTLQVKEVGIGVAKLTFLIENVEKWEIFLNNQ